MTAVIITLISKTLFKKYFITLKTILKVTSRLFIKE
jgi:hypothetical protein